MTLLRKRWLQEIGYELLSPPIFGGGSTVYQARCLRSEKTVALKIPNPARDATCMTRESQTLQALQHPCIAAWLDSGCHQNQPYLVTQWVAGRSLLSHLRNGPLSFDAALLITQQIAEALQHAHEQHIVHGDLSPSNVLLCEEHRRVTLIDFGIARLTSDATLTAGDELAGTPRYLAPEIIHGQPPNPASDQYALALISFEMLTGRWPFSADAPNAASALHHQLYTPPVAISELEPRYNKSLDLIFDTALSKLPENRYTCVSEFAAALERAEVERATHATQKRVRSVRFRKSLLLGTTAAALLGAMSFSTSQQRPAQSTVQSTVQSTAHTTQPGTCNLYGNTDFAKPLEQNFYRDKNNDTMATIVSRDDIDSSPLMQLGTNHVYGMYGVIIPISTDQIYQFSADLWFEDYVHDARLTIVWLDRDWQVIEGADSTYSIEDKFDQRYHYQDITPPTQAHYAVPTVFKDASAGIALADNIVFSPRSGSCTL